MSTKGVSLAVYAGSVSAVGTGTTVAWTSPNTIAALIGATCAVGGLVIAYMNYRLNKRYKRMHYELDKARTNGDNP